MDRFDTIAPYINARVSGMRSRLLSHAQLENLIDYDDVARVVDTLVASPYEQDMAEALTRFKGADAIEEAVSRNLVKAFQTLLHLTTGPFRDLMEIFLLRWDLLAVKSLLRMRHHALNLDEGMAGLAAGPSMTVPLLRSFAERGSMDDLVSALVLWKPRLCGALQRALPVYQGERSVQTLEEALDRTYFVEHAKALGDSEEEDARILRTVLGMEIDRINIRILFQLKDPGAPPESLAEQLLPKGTLSARTLQAVASARDAAAAMEVLGPTVYRDLSEMLFMFVQSARFSPMERMFELLLIRHLARMSRTHVMSIAVPMHYAWLKHNEVVNLRLIARGEASHLPRGRVREEVMYA